MPNSQKSSSWSKGPVLAGLSFSLLLTLLLPARARAENEAPATPQARVELQFEVRGPAREPLSGRVLVRPVDRSIPPQEVAVEAGKVSPLLLEAGRGWDLRVELPGYWTFGHILNLRPGQDSLAYTVRLWPVEVVSGQLQVATPALKPPSALEARFVPPPHQTLSDESPAGHVDCEVDAKKRFLCRLPAAVLDLSLRSAGFAPSYRWGFEVKAGRPTALGTVVLRPGASLAGFVLAEGGALAPSRLELVAQAYTGPGCDPRGAAKSLAAVGHRAVVDQRGFFQVKDLPAGAYLVRAEQPGFAPAQAGPFEVRPGQETFLPEPLTLQPPANLRLTLSPPLDWRGKPWLVQFTQRVRHQSAPSASEDYSGPASEEGVLVLPGRAPGPYELHVLDSAGNRFFSANEPFTLLPGANEQSLELSVVQVKGEATLGKKPLVGDLFFGGRFEAQTMQLATDEDGHFSGLLPRGGAWNVEPVTRGGERLGRVAVAVEPNRRGEAEVAVHLPDTRLFGRVVGENGAPVAGALVNFGNKSAPRRVPADASGRFELRGFPPGLYPLLAEAPPGGEVAFAEAQLVDVAEDSPRGPIELVLKRALEVQGRLLLPDGAPATGLPLTLTARTGKPVQPVEARTDTEGTFSARVPSGASTLLLDVGTQAQPWQAVELPAQRVLPAVTLTLDSGSLRLVLPRPADALEQVAPFPLIFSHGISRGFGSLWKYLSQTGQPLPTGNFREIAAQGVAPGEYMACLVSLADYQSFLYLGQTQPAGRCVSGRLEPGGTLELKLEAP